MDEILSRRPPVDDSSDLMTPQEFVARWSVSTKRLAKICGCSYTVAKCWFMEGEASYCKPRRSYCRLLFLQDEKWNNTIRINKAKEEGDRLRDRLYKRSA